MLVMTGPMAMVAFVLLASGLLKLAQPEPARATLRRLGLPGGTATARMLGVAEVLVALLALGVGGSAVGFVLALLFAIFSVISWRLVAGVGAESQESCGCFGSYSAPPSRLHVVLNVAGTVAAGAGAVFEAPPLRTVVSNQGAAGWALAGVAALGGALALAVMTVLAATLAAANPDSAAVGEVRLFSLTNVAP